MLAVRRCVARADEGDGAPVERGGVALDGDDGRRAVRAGEQRGVVGIADEDEPSTGGGDLIKLTVDVGRGRDSDRGPAASVGQGRQGVEGSGRVEVTVEQTAIGDGPDAFGADQPKLVDDTHLSLTLFGRSAALCLQ